MNNKSARGIAAVARKFDRLYTLHYETGKYRYRLDLWTWDILRQPVTAERYERWDRFRHNPKTDKWEFVC